MVYRISGLETVSAAGALMKMIPPAHRNRPAKFSYRMDLALRLTNASGRPNSSRELTYPYNVRAYKPFRIEPQRNQRDLGRCNCPESPRSYKMLIVTVK